MSQIMIPKMDRSVTVLFHDLYFLKKKTHLSSTVKEATCAICGKSLDEGISVTAKKIGKNLRLFCQYHLPKDC